MRILIVEDEINLSKPLKKGFEKQGFAVDIASDGKEGYEMATINPYDCIVLDLNLPEMDGIDVAKKLRLKDIQTPILMLTARSAQDEKIEGLETGADDYLTKPFNFKELVLRVKVLIKRFHPEQTDVLSSGDLEMDPSKHEVLVNKKVVLLNRKEFAILEYLLRNKSRVVSQEELLDKVWDQEVNMFTNTIRTQMLNLRKKVDPKKKLIQTIRGVGYKIDD